MTCQGPPSQLQHAFGILFGAEGGAPPVPGTPALVPSSAIGMVQGTPPPVLAVAPNRAESGGITRPDADEVQLQLTVPDNLAGAILGRGGATIRETQERGNCRIKMEARGDHGVDRRCLIAGKVEDALLTQGLMLQQMREATLAAGLPEPAVVSVTIFVRKEACGAVIGKQGSGITQLREQCGAKITLTDTEVDGLRPCHIEGTVEQVSAAERGIHELAREVPLTAASAAALTGDGSALFCTTAVKRSWDGTDGGLVMSAPLAKRRRSDEEDGTGETKLLIPEQAAGLVIGKQGANLRSVRETCNVRVDVLPKEKGPQWQMHRLVIIRGPASSRGAAAESILRLCHKQHENSVLKMLVPAVRAAHVSGEGGRNLQLIQEIMGINVSLAAEDVMGEHLLTLEGTSQVLWEAAKQIIPLVDGGELSPAELQQRVAAVASGSLPFAQDYETSYGAAAQAYSHAYGLATGPAQGLSSVGGVPSQLLGLPALHGYAASFAAPGSGLGLGGYQLAGGFAPGYANGYPLTGFVPQSAPQAFGSYPTGYPQAQSFLPQGYGAVAAAVGSPQFVQQATFAQCAANTAGYLDGSADGFSVEQLQHAAASPPGTVPAAGCYSAVPGY